MKAIIEQINKMESNGETREFFGQLYDNSGKLVKSNELISSINPSNGGWQWQVHVLGVNYGGETKGSCLTYQEACNHMKACLKIV